MEKLILKVRVNPRSSINQVTNWDGDMLSIKLTAPPVDGAANKACIEFLSNLLNIKKSQISLVSGHTGRDKSFAISGMTFDNINKCLMKY